MSLILTATDGTQIVVNWRMVFAVTPNALGGAVIVSTGGQTVDVQETVAEIAATVGAVGVTGT